MKVFIYTVASPVIGGSHFNRMQVLDKKFKINGIESYFYTDLKKFRKQVSSIKEKIIVIVDVPASYNGDLSFLAKCKAKVIGYEYSGNLVFDYNIVPFLSQFRKFNAKKEIYTGLKYFIIRDEIIRQKKISQATLDGVLITLGAGKTKKNALDLRKRILRQNSGLKVEIIVGKFSKELTLLLPYIKKNPVNFARHISTSKIVFTNGGSTLVESIYLNKKIICWPQTQFEYEFAEYLSGIYDFKIINNVDTIPELKMIKKISKKHIKNEIDGRGADRVFRLLCDIINN